MTEDSTRAVTVTRLVTRDRRRHRLMKSLFIRARMIEYDNERDLVIVGGNSRRPYRGGHLWSHVWALTDTVPLARRAGGPRALAWHNEALTTAQRSGMRSLARDLLQLA